jgi:ribA/ribD-fused uncharacterized protein
MVDVIEFYSIRGPYGGFSNFSPYPIHLKWRRWPTSEHYFQAQKFLDPQDQERVRRAKTASLAANLGRDRRRKIRSDWESVKVSVMREAIEIKFRQHPDLRDLLLSTGEAKLVERTNKDRFWGAGDDGQGKNMLGKILMEVRQKLRIVRDIETNERNGGNSGEL